jgi:hypothetical protein
MKKSPLTPSTIPPPSINRQHSYTSHSVNSSNHTSTPLSPRPASTDPRNILSQVASRAASPRRTNSSPSGSPYSYNSGSPPGPESPSETATFRSRISIRFLDDRESFSFLCVRSCCVSQLLLTYFYYSHQGEGSLFLVGSAISILRFEKHSTRARRPESSCLVAKTGQKA